MSRFISIIRNTESSQSKNCWLYLQVGKTAIYFWRFWRMDNEDTAWRIEIATN